VSAVDIVIIEKVVYFYKQFPGAIAQLGERLNGIQEVSGSIPLSSTKGLLFKPFALFENLLVHPA
jgi:hypothetical protein